MTAEPRAVLTLTQAELRLLAGAMDAATVQGRLVLPYARLRVRLEEALAAVHRAVEPAVEPSEPPEELAG